MANSIQAESIEKSENKTKIKNEPQQEWHASNRITNIILFMRCDRRE